MNIQNIKDEITEKDQILKSYWKNKKVLITGGTAGLGKSLAIYLDNLGAKTVVIGRSEDKIKDIKDNHSSILTLQADISNKNDIYKISGEVIGLIGGIDVLFNNASYLGITPLLPLIDTECEDLQKVIETNLTGPFRLIKAILPSMILNGKGLIVNISSDAAVNAYENWGSYSISKAAFDHLTKIWQEELNQDDIRLLAIDPGDMYTTMHMDAIPDANIDELYRTDLVARDLSLFIAIDNENKINKVRFSADEWRNEI